MWNLNFIKEEDFKKHIEDTIRQYGDRLLPFDLKKFNKNIIDPVKLIFDKSVYGFTWEEIVKNEIFRQRDKSNNNDVGYFHQRIFQYFKDCEVPQNGWDVIFAKEGGILLSTGDRIKSVFVEIKNKHNTMNSSSSAKTYIKMQSQLLNDDDCACLLVEVIAKKSQDITWVVTVDGQKRQHRRIRRMSIDEFYALVTGQDNAFYQICMQLPKTINKVVSEMASVTIPCDTVIDELGKLASSKNGSFVLALFLLGFNGYKGF
ncbi:MAG: Eco47II family restriction endonuclease [Defluviitaleaceae bacterium]|nr:Eco47II family restriction endonuclease [Defluviitaleaceae bacterium]